MQMFHLHFVLVAEYRVDENETSSELARGVGWVRHLTWLNLEGEWVILDNSVSGKSDPKGTVELGDKELFVHPKIVP